MNTKSPAEQIALKHEPVSVTDDTATDTLDEFIGRAMKRIASKNIDREKLKIELASDWDFILNFCRYFHKLSSPLSYSACRECRKSLARWLSGSLKKRSGVFSSTICPPSMKITLSATRRAKFISCVTISMVMPSFTSSAITLSTSWIISGSRALVGSSKSMTLGCIARERAIAARCCWPPDNWAGTLSA